MTIPHQLEIPIEPRQTIRIRMNVGSQFESLDPVQRKIIRIQNPIQFLNTEIGAELRQTLAYRANGGKYSFTIPMQPGRYMIEDYTYNGKSLITVKF